MADDPTKYFSRRAVVNFDIIHHECRGDPLKRSYKEHQTATNEDFEKFPEHDKKKKDWVEYLETLRRMICGLKET